MEREEQGRARLRRWRGDGEEAAAGERTGEERERGVARRIRRTERSGRLGKRRAGGVRREAGVRQRREAT